MLRKELTRQIITSDFMEKEEIYKVLKNGFTGYDNFSMDKLIQTYIQLYGYEALLEVIREIIPEDGQLKEDVK